MTRSISRRSLAKGSFSGLGVALVGASVFQRGGEKTLAQTEGTPQPAPSTPGAVDPLVGEALSPSWKFGVSVLEDPYRGVTTRPVDLPPGNRIVGVEVIITNSSDQPLEFTVPDVRLHDVRGFQYAAGEAYGTEPRLVSQNLPGGERTRGWVWFMTPEDSQPLELVFNGPQPTFRVTIGA